MIQIFFKASSNKMQLSTNLQDIEVQCVVWCQHCFWGATLRGFHTYLSEPV